jgi:peptidoglycan/xylan/chitin deacetylase (PgdA/CDA1 family)
MALFRSLLLVLIVSAVSVSVGAQQTQTPPRRQIAITFDDLPATHGDDRETADITQRLLASIARNNVPAIGFVNESKLYSGGALNADMLALLRRWLDAGLELGNHTYSHIAIDRASLDEYKTDVIRGEMNSRPLLEERGKRLRYVRHTQLRTGPTLDFKQGLDAFLSARGYTTAPVTIDNNDFIFAAVYMQAKRRGDHMTMRRVGDAYVPYMESVFAHFERLSSEFLGYEVKQTLLLHANEINADYLDDLCRMMARRGYVFVPLDQALTDPAYNLPDVQVSKGLSWIHRWMLAAGRPMTPEPLEPEFVRGLFNGVVQ